MSGSVTLTCIGIVMNETKMKQIKLDLEESKCIVIYNKKLTQMTVVQVKEVVSEGLKKAIDNYNDTVMQEQMDFVQTEVSTDMSTLGVS